MKTSEANLYVRTWFINLKKLKRVTTRAADIKNGTAFSDAEKQDMTQNVYRDWYPKFSEMVHKDKRWKYRHATEESLQYNQSQ